MKIEINTIKEATKYWGRGFNAIPTEAVRRLTEGGWDGIEELTTPTVGDRVECCDDRCEEGTIVFKDGPTYVVQLDDGGEEAYTRESLQVLYDELLPMWGWMWTFEENIDEIWARENPEILSDCGFRVYDSDDFGIIIGIDGAGYDFYEEHWIPLYRARGLKWHE